jgi:hypothetical protein
MNYAYLTIKVKTKQISKLRIITTTIYKLSIYKI